MTLAELRYVCTQTVREWIDDRAPSQGAALAFYSVLSLGPLLLIAIAIAGLVFGEEAASGRMMDELQGLLGREGAATVQSAIAHSRGQQRGIIATAIGVGTLLFAATGVFGQMQDALNHIWKVEVKRGGLIRLLHKRLLSFAMVLGIGFLLLVSLVVSAGLAAVSERVDGMFPPLLMEIFNFVLSFGITTLLFAMIYNILPDVRIRWRDVWIGAAITALLFVAGKSLIGLYLGQSTLSSTYGAAGSLIVILVWVYYSSQLLFLGAEFTKIQARMAGARRRPEAGAALKDRKKD